MKFSEEYKKSAENMSPDRQTIDRMKAAVLKELQEHPDVPAEPLEKPKKPLPLRRIAYIGGAVAACAVITVAAVNIVPSLKASNGMISSGSNVDSSVAIAANETTGLNQQETATIHPSADIAEEAVADECPDCDNISGEIANADSFDYGVDDAMPNPGAGDSDGTIYPEQSFDNATDDPTINADSTGNSSSAGNIDNLDKSHPNPTDSKINELIPATVETPDFPSEEPDHDDDKWMPPTGGRDDFTTKEAWDVVTEDSCYTAETTMEITEATCDALDETEEMWFSEEVCATEESDEDNHGNPQTGGAWTIVRSPQGWLTADGERYDAVKNAYVPTNTGVIYWASSPVENRDFCLVIDGDMLYLFDDKMRYLGAYKKR